jgi:hypothetical protein
MVRSECRRNYARPAGCPWPNQEPAEMSCDFKWKPLMGLGTPAHVSVITGRHHGCFSAPCFGPHAIIASRAKSPLSVLMMASAPSSNPDCSTHFVPVISLLALRGNQPAQRFGVFRTARQDNGHTCTSGILVRLERATAIDQRANPICTPAPSVIASSGPGVSSNGTLKKQPAHGHQRRATAIEQPSISSSRSFTMERNLESWPTPPQHRPLRNPCRRPPRLRRRPRRC